jgi:hypothetical protein
MLPVNESTTMIVTNVKRANGDPVITGSVKFIPDPALDTSTVTVQQSTIRDSSGTYTIAIKGYPAGTHFGEIRFKDPTKTHAKSTANVEFSLLQGPEPTPKPKVTKPVVRNPTLDGCRNQVRM